MSLQRYRLPRSQVGWECACSFRPWATEVPGSGEAGTALLHDLGASMATCCPFYTKAACASRPQPALISPGSREESPGRQRSALAEKSTLESTKCSRPAREPWASRVVTSAPSTAVTTTRYPRHCRLLSRGSIG